MKQQEHEIKVIIPEEIIESVKNIDVTIYFKEKANCKKFTDKEGVKYITGYKQEGKSNNAKSKED